MLNFIFKSALYSFLIKKYKKEISTILKSLFTLVLVIFVYSDIVDLFIILDKKDILVYLFLTKWFFVVTLLLILFKNLKSLFQATIEKVNDEVKIDEEIIKSSNRPTQTQEIFENIKNNNSNDIKKETYSKDSILKEEKLNSLGDNILKKYSEN